jgi:site-specific recombinase XerC
LGSSQYWMRCSRRHTGRALRLVPSIDPEEWSPRELRHSFVSVLSDAGVPLEEISRLVGHSGTTVTELVYRHQLKPVLQTGATVMDQLFKPRTDRAWATAAVTRLDTHRGRRRVANGYLTWSDGWA